MRIQYDTTEGPPIGAGVRYTERHLTISGPPFRATYTTTLSPNPGTPIGEFEVSIPNDQAEELRQAAHSITWERQTKATGGGPGRSYLELKYEDATLQREAGFSQMDRAYIDQIDEFLWKVVGVVGLVQKHPKRALKLTVTPGKPLGAPMELEVMNIGTHSLCVFDPRRLSSLPGEAYAAVNVATIAPSVPGVTSLPPQWEGIGLLPPDNAGVMLRHSTLPPLVLKPGQTQSFKTASWTPTAGADYAIQGVIHDYEAPEQLNGIPCIRGAVFSPQLTVQQP